MDLITKILLGDDYLATDQAADIIRAGGLVGMPTETVYGLAADALNAVAVAKVFQAKQRPSFDPLIVHVSDIDHASEFGVFSDVARQLAEAFWPGSLTLVLPRKKDAKGAPIVPDLVTSGLDAVGLRIPAHPAAQHLIMQSGTALAAPSANRFGSISPTTAQHVMDELSGRIDAVLDGGPCDRGLESTVVRVTDDDVEVLRLGAIPTEQVEAVLGQSISVRPPSSSPGAQAKPAPGMVERHYAPRTAMRFFQSLDEFEAFEPAGKWALLYASPQPEKAERFDVLRNLSESGDLAFAAAGLFSTLRELDRMGLDGIASLAVPYEGLGCAINDRLERGSA